jgi:lincosamide nucleotidyltransferase A/C/D/E
MAGPADPVPPAARDALWHWVVRISRAIYLGVERSRLAPVLDLALVRGIKARVTYVPADVVLRVLGALDDAGVAAWLAGGWGVDALAGRQTRRHYDVDIVVGAAPDVRRDVAAVLAGAGFRETTVEHNDGLLMPVRWAWHDDNGRVVDILPVALDEPPFGDGAFARGRIVEHDVPCLSAALQVTLHSGYAPRDFEPHDMDLLRESGAMPA